jgi:hypothetical protein
MRVRGTVQPDREVPRVANLNLHSKFKWTFLYLSLICSNLCLSQSRLSRVQIDSYDRQK